MAVEATLTIMAATTSLHGLLGMRIGISEYYVFKTG